MSYIEIVVSPLPVLGETTLTNELEANALSIEDRIYPL